MKNYNWWIKKALFVFGVLVLVVFLSSINFSLFFVQVKKVGILAFLLLILLTATNILVKAIRWKLLVKKISGASISSAFSFSSIIAGVAAGSVLPARIELAKPLMVKSTYHVRFSHSFSALIIERVLDFLALLVILCVSLFFVPQQNFMNEKFVLFIIVLLILGIISLIFFTPFFVRLFTFLVSLLPIAQEKKSRLVDFVTHMITSFAVLKDNFSTSLFFLASFAAHIIEIFRFYLLFQFLGISLSWGIVGFGFSAGIVAGILTTIPGGIGVTEYSTTELISQLAGSDAIIKTAVLIDRVISYYLLIALGSIILLFYNKLFKEHKAFKPE